MKLSIRTAIMACLLNICFPSPCFSEPIIIDHNDTDLSKIPDYWINRVKSKINVYFGHTSHGQQIATGLRLIEEHIGKKYDVSINRGYKGVAGALNIRNRTDTYNPEDFFVTIDSTLEINPEINVVMYGWCSQPNNNNWETLLNDYIRKMNQFEKRYPRVTFVFMTAHAQRRDCEGCNRHRFNEALRAYCRKNKKVLFDFGDIDVWYEGSANSYIAPNWCACAGRPIPVEHSRYGGGSGDGPCEHTTSESCMNKGKAMWWLLARISGWNPGK